MNTPIGRKKSILYVAFNIHSWLAVFIAYLVLSVDLFVPWKQEQRNGPDHRLAQVVSNGIGLVELQEANKFLQMV